MGRLHDRDTTASGHDIRTQRSAFEALDAAASTPGELAPVRLLDILAWMSQGRPQRCRLRRGPDVSRRCRASWQGSQRNVHTQNAMP